MKRKLARSVSRSAVMPAESMVRPRKRSPARKKTARLISQPGAADQIGVLDVVEEVGARR